MLRHRIRSVAPLVRKWTVFGRLHLRFHQETNVRVPCREVQAVRVSSEHKAALRIQDLDLRKRSRGARFSPTPTRLPLSTLVPLLRPGQPPNTNAAALRLAPVLQSAPCPTLLQQARPELLASQQRLYKQKPEQSSEISGTLSMTLSVVSRTTCASCRST